MWREISFGVMWCGMVHVWNVKVWGSLVMWNGMLCDMWNGMLCDVKCCDVVKRRVSESLVFSDSRVQSTVSSIGSGGP